jgi:hypothetical protein
LLVEDWNLEDNRSPRPCVPQLHSTEASCERKYELTCTSFLRDTSSKLNHGSAAEQDVDVSSAAASIDRQEFDILKPTWFQSQPSWDKRLAGNSSEFDALEKLRKLAFAEQVPEPTKRMLLPIATADEDYESEED